MSATSTSEKFSYMDTSLSFAERAKDLVRRLSLDEKVSLMNHPAQGVPRLNIPAYNYWSEALHGVARDRKSTRLNSSHLALLCKKSDYHPILIETYRF